MKQDKAEAQAIADALLHRLQVLPAIDQQQGEYLAPELQLFSPPTLPAGPAQFVGPREKGIPTYLRDKFAEHREFFANKAGSRLYSGAADAEWSRMPIPWRIVMLMMGGIGEVESDMHYLAGRSWQIMPPAERDAIRAALREAFNVLQGTRTLRLRTT